MIMMIIARAASGELIQATVVILWNGLSENKSGLVACVVVHGYEKS